MVEERALTENPLWPPTTLSLKAINGKRPTLKALESNPPTISQSLPPTLIQESIPPSEMAKQESFVPSHLLGSSSRSYRNCIVFERKRWQKALAVE